MLTPVIMAGGTGTRLWPLSRALYPKQFLPLHGDHTMLQSTLKRLSAIETAEPLIICNEEHRFIVAEQLRAIQQLGPIILEPEGRNTAPAIALAAQVALTQKNQTDPLLLVLAADHVIQNEAAFLAAIHVAVPLAQQGKMVTFGIVPDSPHTGYGYIKRGQPQGDSFVVDGFVEKPDQVTAQQYSNCGDYYWNSGMFMFKASRYLQELEKYAPEMLAICKKAIASESTDLEFVRVDADVFVTCPDDSIDYAVMEKTDSACVVPLDAGWSDVGSWSSLWDTAKQKDAQNNVVIGDAILDGVSNSYINSEERLISVVGLDNVVVVETKDAVLVAHKGKVQNIKNVVNQLKAEHRPEWEFHREVFRPWGSYDSIDNGERFQVKRITVKPGEKLSVQMHHHRAEHWIVVSGTAKVTNGEQTLLLSENQSTYIPIGVVHALENPGCIPLELIEVQSGSYLGEDDIVRFSDRYGRVETK